MHRRIQVRKNAFKLYFRRGGLAKLYFPFVLSASALTFFHLRAIRLNQVSQRSEPYLSISMKESETERILNQHDSSSSTAIQDHHTNLLPTFENGGVVLFFHTAKTGGTSVRHTFSAREGVQFHRCDNSESLATALQRIPKFLTQTQHKQQRNKGIYFVELHGDVPGFAHLVEQLRSWRSTAKQFDTSVFAFGFVREPISFLLSYFLFFQAEPCQFSWCEPPLYDPKDEWALAHKAAVPAHQCLWWARKTHDWRQEPSRTAEECRSVTKLMLTELDWVGTTEEMTTVTMPLLAYLVFKDHKAGRGLKKQNKNKKGGLTVESLKPETLEKLRQMSAYDQEIYDAVKQRFRLAMFDNVPHSLLPSRPS